MLQVNSVVKRFGKQLANNNVSITVPEKSIYGLLGPNGAGKTTLIRMITNIILPDEGTILLDGDPVGAQQQNLIGYLPEERGLYKKLKVGEQLVYFGRLKGLSSSDATKRMRWWLNRMQAEGWESKKIQELSKGMQQKVQFISTVLHEPKLLILDEPFSGLDPINADLLIDVIHELQQRGTTIILSTHQMDQVERLCNKIALINKGTVVVESDLYSLKRKFRSNVVELRVDSDSPSLDSIPGTEVISHNENRITLKMNDGTSANDVLQAVIPHHAILSFEVKEPSLHQIFIESVTNN